MWKCLNMNQIEDESIKSEEKVDNFKLTNPRLGGQSSLETTNSKSRKIEKI